ncbi:copper chaperone PCu(A)C [Piscinibacter sakaiensis]|nr:copper chaperone PCu(A)C [Piscinibacter sakaiensis]
MAAALLVAPLLCRAGPTGKVVITDAWLRSPPHGHRTTLGFMTLRATEDMTLVGIKTASAKSVSLQLMTREGSVVRMDPVDSVPLAAGAPVTFKMGPGQHFMQLTGIGAGVRAGQVVTMIAIVQDPKSGIKQAVRFEARVRPPEGGHAEPHGEH